MSSPSLILPAYNLETSRSTDARLANLDPDSTLHSLSNELRLAHGVGNLSYNADYIISRKLNTPVTNDLRAPTEHEVKLLEKVIHQALHPQLIPTDGQRATFPNLEVSTYESEYIPPLHPDWSIQVIQSAMGTDKTGKLCQYLKDSDLPSTTFTSPRRTFTRSCAARFREQGIPIKSYLDAGINAEDDFVIISAESLRQLKTISQVLAMDEATSTLTQMDSGLHKNLSDNQQMLVTLVRDCPKIVVMDADIDIRVLMLIHILRPNEIVHYQINTIKKRKDWMAFRLDEITMYNQLSHDLKAGKNVKIICGSEKYAEKYLEPVVKSIVGTENYRFYHSKGDKIRPDELDNVDIVWSRLRVLMYTSTISQGVSFMKKHFHSIYVFGNSQSNTIRETGQMTGRVRLLVNLPDEEDEPKKVYYWNQTRRENLPDTYEAIKRQIEGHLQMGNLDLIKFLGTESRQLRAQGSKVFWELKDTFWTWLSIQNQLERNRSRNNYDQLFLDMLDRQGIRIGKTIYTENADASEYSTDTRYYLKEKDEQILEFKTWKKSQDAAWKKNQSDNLSEASWFTNSRHTQQCRVRRENGDATSEELVSLKKSELLQHIDSRYVETLANDGEKLLQLSDNLPQLLNCQIVRDWSGRDVALQDIKNQNYDRTVIPELNLPKFEGINWLCQVIGVKDVLDRDTVVCSETIRQRVDLIVKNIYLLDLRFKVKHNPINDYPGVIRYINARMKSWAGCVLSEVRKERITIDGKRVHVKYYSLRTPDGFDDILSMMPAKPRFSPPDLSNVLG